MSKRKKLKSALSRVGSGLVTGAKKFQEGRKKVGEAYAQLQEAAAEYQERTPSAADLLWGPQPTGETKKKTSQQQPVVNVAVLVGMPEAEKPKKKKKSPFW